MPRRKSGVILTSIGRANGLVALAFAILMSFHVSAQSPTEALFQAVELNDLDRLEDAINSGADLSATNAEGMTPADVAVDLGHFRIAHILLARRTTDQPSTRVTEKAGEALVNPKKRLPAQPAGGAQQPTPKLADVSPPKKPILPRATAPAAAPPPAVQPEAPARIEPAPAEPDVTPRPDDEIATSPPTDPVQKEQEMAATEEGGGFLDSVWGGLKDVVTLGGLIGGGDEEAAPTETTPGQRSAGLSSPADRFRPRQNEPSDSAAGRMVDRLTGIVDGEKPRENEFGLPEEPVVALPEELQSEEIPGLAPPVDDGETLAPLSPPDDVGQPQDIAIAEPELPGTVEIPGTSLSELGDAVPGLLPSELPNGPAPPDPVFPEVPSDEDIPGLAVPELPDTSDELDIPGLAAPELPDEPGTDEVPGILPPPSDLAGEIPGLPPGLEPLPGSNTGQLRRPGGLVEPEDPSVLPAPGTESLASRLQRIDDVLNRTPELNERGRARLRRQAEETQGPLTATAPKKAPVEVGQPDPLMEVPKGLEDTTTVTRKRDITPKRPSRQELIKRAEQEPIRDKTAIRKPRRLAGHEVATPVEPVTKRDDPSSRMIERLARIGGGNDQEEDIHGLPIVRAPATDSKAPRRGIEVTETKQRRQDKADERIHALARFFRGDQEEEVGMTPPEPSVTTEPLPKVIDDLLAENDPARGRIVDDSLLDLSQVEGSEQVAASPEPRQPVSGGRLNETFLDKLSTVLTPKSREPKGVSQPIPEPGTVDVDELDIPDDQTVKQRNPSIPDPWTMTVEKNDTSGSSTTLGVTAISPEDGSELQRQEGVVTQMVGRIRELLVGPREQQSTGTSIDSLDDEERQEAAERLLSDALRDGPPTALPDAGAWSVTEVEAKGDVPGVPPQPRAGVLSRTSLEDVILSIGESVTLENTLPPQQDGVDPLNECIKKNRGTTLFCVEPVDWPQDLRGIFTVPTILYTGPMAITRYDQGTPSRFHSLFDSEQFESVVAYFQSRYGEPTEIWKRSIAPLAKPRMDNPTVTWRSRDRQSNVITVLEIRKFDDTRGGFPDTTRGAVMLYLLNAPSIFPQVSSHELMRLRRTR